MAVSMYSMTSQQTEPSPVSAASDFLKRPLHHDLQSTELESDFEPAVKMKCSAGGRRKQSKPIRVRSDVDAGPVHDVVVDMKLPATDSPSARASSPRTTDARQPVSVDAHVSYELDETAAVFPTKYHQLGSELKQEVGLGSYEPASSDAGDNDAGKPMSGRSELAEDAHTTLDDLRRSPRQYFDRREAEFSLDVKPLNQFADNFYKSSQGAQMQEQCSTSKTSDCLPTNLSVRSMKLESPGNTDVYSMQTSARSYLSDVDMSRAEMHETERFWESSDGAGAVEKSRIFHPDAYCDICDREFCNKYFLKTHRANKHGIYDGSASDAAGVSGPVLTEGPSVSLEADRERTTPNSLSCSSAPSLPGVLAIPQLPSSFSVLPFDDALLPPAPPPPPQQQQPSRAGSDMEDYCDICQKHFCNKYYLRKHRQDVHGLSPADVAARRAHSELSRDDTAHFPLRVSSSTAAASCSLPGPPPSALSNFPVFLPPPFGAPLPVVSPFLPGAPGLGFGSLQFGADGANSKLSTSSSSSASSQHQQLSAASSSLLPGMLSADAYMDLFRKELLGGYLMNNGDRDMTAAFAAVAAAAAAASGPGDPATAGLPPPPRLPPLPTGPEPGTPATPIKLETGVNATPDTFAEMLQRIGARIGKKSEGGLGALQHDLLRLNGLGARLPGSVASSATSSRLVDRVVCDLCNKEVCNKYFLKTHKMKVHGWDPNTSTVLPTTSASGAPAISAEAGLSNLDSKLSSIQPQPPLMYHPSLADSQVDKPLTFPASESSTLTPKDAELQQMGIDPEAYCEICRKEFCSKYFLRTHRQNIHGIQDTSSSSSPGSVPHCQSVPSVAPLFSSTGPFSSVQLALPPPPPPGPACLPSTMPTNSSTSVSSSMFLFGAGLSASNESSSGSSDGHVVEQRSWKWKEPVNATRVSCTLCNKVLCNKYFLRTHMAKRHGVTVDTRLLPPQAPLVPAVRDLTNGLQHQSVGVDSVPAPADGAEQTKDNVNGKASAVNLVLGASRSSNDLQTVTARTWHVPADDTAEPPSQTDVASCTEHQSADSAVPVKQPDETVKCPLCATGMSDRELLLHHLTSIHHVDEQMSVSLVAASSITETSSSTSPGSAGARTPPTGGSVRRRRQFRCAYCRERFRTRVHCELHARAAHPRATGSCVEVTPALDAVDVVTSPPATSLPGPVYGTPLDADDAARALMLPFIVRESVAEGAEPSFSTALVYLPSFRRLTSPTTVSFSLTPILQP